MNKIYFEDSFGAREDVFGIEATIVDDKPTNIKVFDGSEENIIDTLNPEVVEAVKERVENYYAGLKEEARKSYYEVAYNL